MKATPKHITEARERHHAALAALYHLATGKPYPGKPLSLWRAIRRIERDASAAATAQCNGERCAGQPFRMESEWDAFREAIAARVAKAFGGTLPQGFFFNTDPRGYALKLDRDQGTTIPAGLVTDIGGYGILAAEIDT